MKKASRMAAALALAGGLSCAWVPLDPGAEAVAVRTPAEVEACERIGRTNTRTLGGLGPIPRREGKVTEELVALARNEAVRMGGNAVAPLEAPREGEQRFGIYRCP